MGHAASQTCPGEARHACEPQARQRSGQGSVVQTGMARARAFSDTSGPLSRNRATVKSRQVKSAKRNTHAEYSRLPRKFDTPLLITNLSSEKVTEASQRCQRL